MSVVFKSSALDLFLNFFQGFKKSDLWWAMVNTRENTKWHREPNVGVHTQMLIDWYIRNRADHRSDDQRMFTLLACLFHDVGKPSTEVVKFSEERGEYRSYPGHEDISAKMWCDYCEAHPSEIKALRLSEDDVSFISLMIENHLPFEIKKFKKRTNLKNSFFEMKGESGHDAWLDLLHADQLGRIPDDPVGTRERLDTWINEWKTVKIGEVV